MGQERLNIDNKEYLKSAIFWIEDDSFLLVYDPDTETSRFFKITDEGYKTPSKEEIERLEYILRVPDEGIYYAPIYEDTNGIHISGMNNVQISTGDNNMQIMNVGQQYVADMTNEEYASSIRAQFIEENGFSDEDEEKLNGIDIKVEDIEGVNAREAYDSGNATITISPEYNASAEDFENSLVHAMGHVVYEKGLVLPNGMGYGLNEGAVQSVVVGNDSFYKEQVAIFRQVETMLATDGVDLKSEFKNGNHEALYGLTSVGNFYHLMSMVDNYTSSIYYNDPGIQVTSDILANIQKSLNDIFLRRVEKMLQDDLTIKGNETMSPEISMAIILFSQNKIEVPEGAAPEERYFLESEERRFQAELSYVLATYEARKMLMAGVDEYAYDTGDEIGIYNEKGEVYLNNKDEVYALEDDGTLRRDIYSAEDFEGDADNVVAFDETPNIIDDGVHDAGKEYNEMTSMFDSIYTNYIHGYDFDGVEVSPEEYNTMVNSEEQDGSDAGIEM